MSAPDYSAPERALAAAHPAVAVWNIDRIYGDPVAAAAALEAFLGDPATVPDAGSKAGAHFALAAARAVLGELNVAEAHLDTAESLFSELGDELSIAHVTLRRDLIWHQREEFERAFAALPGALEIARKHGDGWLQTAVSSDLGLLHLQIGNAPEGVDYLFSALETAQRGADRVQETIVRMNLASAFVELHDFQVAAEWLRQCMELPDIDRKAGIEFECTLQLAICEIEMGQTESSLKLLTRAATLAEQLDYPFGIAESSYDEGRLRLRLGQLDDARAAFRRSIANFRNVDTPIAHARITMCGWWLENIDRKYTRQTYDELSAIAEQGAIAPYHRAFDLHDALAQSAIELGLAKEAVVHLQKSRSLSDDYWVQIANRQARIALKRHQVADVERAAELERQHRAELSRALDEAEALNAQNQQLLTQLKAQSMILAQQATEDSLTGIGNRRYFVANLDRELNRAAQFERPISVALADIDNFKAINDRHSHMVGDEVLVAVAAIIRESLRSSDIYARYGGEEFAFVFPEADNTRANHIAERLRENIERYDWASIADDLKVTMSIGLVSTIGHPSAAQIVSAADSLLYLAKRTGKNHVEHRIVADQAFDNESIHSGDPFDAWVVTQKI